LVSGFIQLGGFLGGTGVWTQGLKLAKQVLLLLKPLYQPMGLLNWISTQVASLRVHYDLGQFTFYCCHISHTYLNTKLKTDNSNSKSVCHCVWFCLCLLHDSLYFIQLCDIKTQRIY
jgi:hypothetical protein